MLEEKGQMDAVEYMQQKVWPVDKILQAGFRIQICWKYYDEDYGITEILKWCTGTVQSIVCDEGKSSISLRWRCFGMLSLLNLEWKIQHGSY